MNDQNLLMQPSKSCSGKSASPATLTCKYIYHYTTRSSLTSIVIDGAIKPASFGVLPPEIAAVWLSTAPNWEHTATKALIDNGVQRLATLAEMVDRDECLVRIQIDPQQVKLIFPLKIREKLRMQKPVWASLMASGKRVGADPNEWRAVAGPIDLEAVVKVEVATETAPLVWTVLENWEDCAV